MNYWAIIKESFRYTKEATLKNPLQWIILSISVILFPLFYGYLSEIYRGNSQPPDMRQWRKYFWPGMRLLLYICIYIAIAIVLLFIFAAFIAFSVLISGSNITNPSNAGMIVIGTLIFMFFEFSLCFFYIIGSICYIRNENLQNALNFKKLYRFIGRIGWSQYTVALIILICIYFVVYLALFFWYFADNAKNSILTGIFLLEWIVLIPVLTIFFQRFITIIYDQGMHEHAEPDRITTTHVSAEANLQAVPSEPSARAEGSSASTKATGHHDVFISYAHDDKPIADAVCATLESKKIRCWIAPRDIIPGINYAESLIKGLDGAKILVLIFSSKSNTSPHTLREVERAVRNNTIIVPFRIEDVLPSPAMEYYIGTPHWLDAFTPPLGMHIENLEKTIRILLDRIQASDSRV